MRAIVQEDLPVRREEVPKPRPSAASAPGEHYKVEIIEGIPDDTVSLYHQGEFVDLCRGPHVPSTGRIPAFRLTGLAAPTGAVTRATSSSSASTARRGRARRTSRPIPARRGGQAARPPPARPGARPLLAPPDRARVAVLPPEGRRRLQPAGRVHPQPLRALRLHRGHHAPHLQDRAVEDLGPLRRLPRRHVPDDIEEESTASSP